MLFGDRIDPRYLWAVFMVFFGAGLVLIVDARTPLLVNAFATCLGIGFGGGVVCLMTVLGNYYGLKAFALLSGIAIAINTTLSRAGAVHRRLPVRSRLRLCRHLLLPRRLVLRRRAGVVRDSSTPILAPATVPA